MGENTLYKRFLPLVILTVGILLQGCKDDVFNPEKVKAAYQDRFPVKNSAGPGQCFCIRRYRHRLYHTYLRQEPLNQPVICQTAGRRHHQ
mgnify:CR=1 FL=1